MLSSGPLDSLIRWLRREDARKTNDDGAGEGTPLLSSDTARADASFSAGMAANEAAVKERIVVATAALCWITSCLSILIDIAALNFSVILSGVLGCVLSPYAVLQQRKLTQIEAYDQTNEAMENEIGELSQENMQLIASANQLEESVKDLPAMEEALAVLQSLEGCALSQLLDDLDSHLFSSIDEEERSIVTRGEVLQVLVTVMDADRSMMMSDAEIESLISSIGGVRGVQVNAVLFRDCIVEHGRSIVGLLEVTRNLLHDKRASNDVASIFQFSTPVELT